MDEENQDTSTVTFPFLVAEYAAHQLYDVYQRGQSEASDIAFFRDILNVCWDRMPDFFQSLVELRIQLAHVCRMFHEGSVILAERDMPADGDVEYLLKPWLAAHQVLYSMMKVNEEGCTALHESLSMLQIHTLLQCTWLYIQYGLLDDAEGILSEIAASDVEECWHLQGNLERCLHLEKGGRRETSSRLLKSLATSFSADEFHARVAPLLQAVNDQCSAPFLGRTLEDLGNFTVHEGEIAKSSVEKLAAYIGLSSGDHVEHAVSDAAPGQSATKATAKATSPSTAKATAPATALSTAKATAPSTAKATAKATAPSTAKATPAPVAVSVCESTDCGDDQRRAAVRQTRAAATSSSGQRLCSPTSSVRSSPAPAAAAVRSPAKVTSTRAVKSTRAVTSPETTAQPAEVGRSTRSQSSQNISTTPASADVARGEEVAVVSPSSPTRKTDSPFKRITRMASPTKTAARKSSVQDILDFPTSGDDSSSEGYTPVAKRAKNDRTETAVAASSPTSSAAFSPSRSLRERLNFVPNLKKPSRFSNKASNGVVEQWSSSGSEDNVPSVGPSRPRRRFRWTAAEVAALKSGARQHGEGAWGAILAASGDLRGRSSVDLKDKWRNMRKKGEVS